MNKRLITALSVLVISLLGLYFAAAISFLGGLRALDDIGAFDVEDDNLV